MKRTRRTQPKPEKKTQDSPYLLQMAEVVGKVKPIWKGHFYQLPNWGRELVILHDLWEEEQKK